MVVFATPEDGNRSRALARPAPAPSIRLAREEELGAIASLFAPALAPYRGAGADEILDAYLTELLDVRSRFGVAETYVAVEDGSVVGSVAFYRDVVLEGWSSFPPGWAGFRALAVSPAARGGGIGRLLVERCLDRAREAGATTLGIHTIETLVDAVRLYERLGFVRSPEFDLRAADVFPSDAPIQSDLVGMAFRREL
ncbi:MAG TPA: GNAT family N-acetyltransferase [Gaiella sp.]|jgi:GNAT superfamily N-acetyltransferase|nr:GNAT family N-acetyltransferase [Gaiella sp.]